jgi:hypothetical protein
LGTILTLECLNLGKNRLIGKIPETFVKNDVLIELCLEGNNLTGTHVFQNDCLENRKPGLFHLKL